MQPQELQTSYFEPDCKEEAAQPLGLDLTLSTALAASDEALHCLTHTVHPALRDKQASINAELAQLCNQRTRGQPAKTYAGLDRAGKVALWRKSLGRSSLEKRLAACIVALPGKKGAKTLQPSQALKEKLWRGKKSARKSARRTAKKDWLKKVVSLKALAGPSPRDTRCFGQGSKRSSCGQYGQAGQRSAAALAVEQAAESAEALAGHCPSGAGARLPAPPSDQPLLPH